MGWLGLYAPQHIEGYINEILRDYNAVEVETMDEIAFTNWVREQVADPGFYNPYGIWFIGTVKPEGKDPQERIGLILLDFDHDSSDANSSVYEKAWMHRVVSAAEGPRRYDSPLEWLDRAPCYTKVEEGWRKKVRKHHARA